jgi:farnesyl-diphosphate farnesyltransferase
MKYPLISMLFHPEEWRYLYELKRSHRSFLPRNKPLSELSRSLSDREFCYASLGRVSRSFAVVIQRLPEEIKDEVCIFYLVLRALDSIEDDTNIGKATREKLLLNFYRYLEDPEWNITGIGTHQDYETLLGNFQKVSSRFNKLEDRYKKVIAGVCKKMGEGMVKYLDQELRMVKDYDDYCYYVAGLVGRGLSELFVISGLEDQELIEDKDLPIEMGLFLQKTNIIRDLLEDLNEGRNFWPYEIWHLYTDRIENFISSHSTEALYCLNHMVTDALKHAPKCLQYLQRIRNKDVFQFCAIPQSMAIATLVEIFHNKDVFKKEVKIRKGLAARLFLRSEDFEQSLRIFKSMADQFFEKISLDDPNVELQVKYLQKILAVSDVRQLEQPVWNDISWPPTLDQEIEIEQSLYNS